MKLKLIFVYNFLIMLLVCNCTNSKKQENKFECRNPSFDSLLVQFEYQNYPINIDSSYYIKFQSNKEGHKLINNKKYQEFLDIPEIKKQCAPEKYQYNIYPINKININNELIGILLLLDLNTNCGFDAYIRKLFLIIYDATGIIKDYKEVGTNEMHWGLIKYTHFKIIDNLDIEQKFIELKENNEGKLVESKISTNKLTIKEGKITSINLEK